LQECGIRDADSGKQISRILFLAASAAWAVLVANFCYGFFGLFSSEDFVGFFPFFRSFQILETTAIATISSYKNTQ
jgi:hypothetical protein